MEQQTSTTGNVCAEEKQIPFGKRAWEMPQVIETDIRATATGYAHYGGTDHGYYS